MRRKGSLKKDIKINRVQIEIISDLIFWCAGNWTETSPAKKLRTGGSATTGGEVEWLVVSFHFTKYTRMERKKFLSSRFYGM